MKTATLKRPGRAFGQKTFSLQSCGVAAMAVSLLLAGNLMAMPAVETISGGPSYGYLDGDTKDVALFHTPIGLAFGSDPLAGDILYVADRDNNAIRKLDLELNQTITFLTSKINKPVGVALDSGGNLYVLNRGNGSNGSVLKFNRYGNFLGTNAVALTDANGLALDNSANLYVTANGNSVIKITPGSFPGTKTTVATIPNANTSLQGITVLSSGTLAVCDAGRHGILMINPLTGTWTNFTGFNGAGDSFGNPASARFNQPCGISAAGGGMLVVTDYGNHRVKTVDEFGNVCSLYGVCSSDWVIGPGSYPGWWDGNGCPCQITCQTCNNYAEARMPIGVLVAPNGSVYTTEDYYHLIREVTSTGLPPPPPPPPPPPAAPTTLSAATNYGQVTLTWSTVIGATNYIVRRSPSSGGPYTIIATTTATSYTDTSVVNGTTYYYVVSASNAGGEGPNSAEVSATPPMPPVPDPQIGYVEFPPPLFASEFHAVSSVTFNNDKPIVIIGAAGTETFYEYANTLVFADVPNPTTNSSSAPVGYQDGLFSIFGLTVASVSPKLTIKAIGHQNGRPDSAIVSAQFEFKVGNPLIVGDNAAQFTVSDITTGAELWYSTDGSPPTDAPPSLFFGTIGGTNGITRGVDFPAGATNLTFKIRGFKANYQPSGVVTSLFSATNFNANKITFGFASGEASSDFIASPGQYFYAPVTLSTLPSAKMYSLQFNITATNLNSAPPLFPFPGYLHFESFLEKPDPANPGLYRRIPPAMFLGLTTNQVITLVTNVVTVTNLYQTVTSSLETNWFSTSSVTNIITTNGNRFITNYVVMNGLVGQVQTVTNPPTGLLNESYSNNVVVVSTNHGYRVVTSFVTLGSEVKVFEVPTWVTNSVNLPAYMDPPPTDLITYPYGPGQPFVDFRFVNPSLNLIGVGWLERLTRTNLYDTIAQDLIKYSQPHDTVFLEENGKVVLGGYAFAVPPIATPGQQYQIKIGRPSATSDGIGTPGSDVIIATPTNGSLTAGAINSIKNVTMGQRKYVAGDCAPFRWFNAGDFGNTNLDNSDVMQVFQSVIYKFNYPPLFSDFFDSMDSCGGTYVSNGNGYLEFNTYVTDTNDLNPLFYGDNITIDQIAFGDGVLDVCDVYVTFRRSLDPSLMWFRRFWTNGVRGAEIVGNFPPPPPPPVAPARAASVKFASGDFTAAAGQTVQIPVTAQISGTYPIRTLLLNLTVDPLDGSPALTSPVQFAPNPALGQPTITDSKGNGNYAATWLNSAIPGLTGNATLGTLTVQVPGNAPSSAAYAIHFDHASASPNGLAAFPKQTQTGLITRSDRSASTWNDGISDAWRLRYFGSINNVLSAATADADGDGHSNWQEYLAGTDPNDSLSVLKLLSKTAGTGPSKSFVVRWPSVTGKHYVIERATAMFGAAWLPVSTNNGTGSDLEFTDPDTSPSARFYRVRVAP